MAREIVKGYEGFAFPKCQRVKADSVQGKRALRQLERSGDKRYWTKKLDRVFSEYIRLRDCHGPNGTGMCITSGKPITFKNCDAGHYVNRRHMALRWDEMNVHAQSKYENRWDEGNKECYYPALVKLYGVDKVSLMLTRKHGRGPDASEMKLLFDDYTRKVKAMKEFNAIKPSEVK